MSAERKGRKETPGRAIIEEAWRKHMSNYGNTRGRHGELQKFEQVVTESEDVTRGDLLSFIVDHAPTWMWEAGVTRTPTFGPQDD